ncbi:hypothetical protein [Amycolatopsis thermoflava]|uniref:hypothetical protein n=1 Tax=Amycolatopsis thermoflava TaxID=84480 RepID=UPI0036594B75
MSARTRKPTSKPETTEPRQDAAPAPETPEAAPMQCTAAGCTEDEADDLGVCRPHYTAGWRYVKEPDRD